MSTFLPNLPTPDESPSVSQPKFQQNFRALNTFSSVNHVGLTEEGTPGKHKFIQMPVQEEAPTTGTAEVAMFARAAPAEAVRGKATEIAIKQPTPTGQTYGFTNYGQGEEVGTGSIKYTQGWTILPSGLLYRWGKYIGENIAKDFTVPFRVNNAPEAATNDGPQFSGNPFFGQLSLIDANLVLIRAIVPHQLELQINSNSSNDRTVRFYFLVVGPA